MRDALSVILEAREHKVYLWKERATPNISFSFDQQSGFPNSLKEQITNYKTKIISILTANKIDSKSKSKDITCYFFPEENHDYVLSDTQKGIYLQTQLDKLATTYNVPVLIQVHGTIDVDLLNQVLRNLVYRHRILRINLVDGLKYRICDVGVIKVSHIRIHDNELDEYIVQQKQYVFDLFNSQLIKLEIVEVIDSDKYIVNLTHHHIIGDAYSVQLLINEVLKAYSLLINHLDDRLLTTQKELRPDYIEFINYQLAQVETNTYNKARKNILNKFTSCVPIKLHAKSKYPDDEQCGVLKFTLDNTVHTKLIQVSQDNQVSLYAILMTCLYYVLSVYNENKQQFAIGTTVSNRIQEFTGAIGPFISTLPLIFEFDASKDVLHNVHQCQGEIIYLNQYSLLNLNKLTENSDVSLNQVRDLMHIMFTMHNNTSRKLALEHTFQYKRLHVDDNTEKFGISIVADEVGNELRFTISYLSDLYDEHYIKQLFNSYIILLQTINQNTIQTPFKSEYLLSITDYQKVINTWNETQVAYPEEGKLIHQLFEEQVNKTPDNVALVYEGTQLTYHELNQSSNQLAHYLRNTYNIKGDDLIALCLDRSEYMLIAMLGVLKSGGAYVPIAPDYPADRIEYILSDTKAKVIIANEKYKSKLTNIIKNIVIIRYTKQSQYNKDTNIYDICLIDAEYCKHTQSRQLSTNPEIAITSKHLAYVIYTSGTTGNPKGVMIEHRNTLNTMAALKAIYQSEQKATAFTSYVFDVSVSEIFTVIITGGELHLLANKTRNDVLLLSKYLQDQKINISYLPPVLLANLEKNHYHDLHRLIYAGEPCDKKTGSYWSNNKQLYNYYGPTECSIYCIGKQVDNGDVALIGRPISNMQAYILDTNLCLLPMGAIGELYIGGAGLARGYLNQAKLTKEKFTSNPFQSEEDKKSGKNARLYKTGDLARYLPDGNIEYIGRNDFQVKIRGYRIELGEIESKLSEYPGIKQVVVMAREHVDSRLRGNDISNKYLVGYYVSREELNQEEVLSYLKEHLPDYMLPNILVHLDNLPLTVNGKLDRKLLPDPEFRDQQEEYVAPRNETEATICKIWQEVLGIDRVGVTDDFFMLGGNSILAMQVITKIRQQLNLVIKIADLMMYRTVANFLDKSHSKP